MNAFHTPRLSQVRRRHRHRLQLEPLPAVARPAGGASRALPGSLDTNRMLDGWIRINPDGTVTVFTGKCELGQGILTALAQIAAEELDVAYERVEMVSADTARTPNEGQTAGSLSVENSGTALRFACAEARQILLGAGRREARRRRRRTCPCRTER